MVYFRANLEVSSLALSLTRLPATAWIFLSGKRETLMGEGGHYNAMASF